MAEFISLCEQFLVKLVRISQEIVEFMTKDIYDAFSPYLPDWVMNILPDGAINVLTNYSITELMFGSGIIFFLGYTLIKFLKA